MQLIGHWGGTTDELQEVGGGGGGAELAFDVNKQAPRLLLIRPTRGDVLTLLEPGRPLTLVDPRWFVILSADRETTSPTHTPVLM